MADTIFNVVSQIVHQDGHVVLGTWNDTLDRLWGDPAVPAASIGIIFDYNLSVDISRTLNFPTQIILQPRGISAAQNDTVVAIGMVPQTAPGDYSTTVQPFSRNEADADNIICAATGDFLGGDQDWQDGVDFAFLLGQTYANGVWTINPTYTRNLWRLWARYIRSSQWSGRIAYSIFQSPNRGPTWASSEFSTSAGPRIVSTQFQAHTGFQGVREELGRAVFDGRSGLPAQAGELQEDKWTPGLYVRPEWWDDEDRSTEAELPDTEGKVFDKVNT